jgi:hypothetical protein
LQRACQLFLPIKTTLCQIGIVCKSDVLRQKLTFIGKCANLHNFLHAAKRHHLTHIVTAPTWQLLQIGEICKRRASFQLGTTLLKKIALADRPDLASAI